MIEREPSTPPRTLHQRLLDALRREASAARTVGADATGRGNPRMAARFEAFAVSVDRSALLLESALDAASQSN